MINNYLELNMSRLVFLCVSSQRKESTSSSLAILVFEVDSFHRLINVNQMSTCKVKLIVFEKRTSADLLFVNEEGWDC